MEAICNFLQLRGTVDGPLFCHRDWAPITQFWFWTITSRALARMGLLGVRFGPHSFRIGAASMVAAMGYPTGDSQRIGRWWSAAFKCYVGNVKY